MTVIRGDAARRLIARTRLQRPLPEPPHNALWHSSTRLLGDRVSPVEVTQRFLREELTSRGLAARIDDASVVLHELVTNAHQHAGGASLVSVSLLPTGLLLEVTDHGALSTSLRSATRLGAVLGPARRRPGSRTRPGTGLKMVSLLSQEWGVRMTPTAKIVWARLHDDHDDLVSAG